MALNRARTRRVDGREYEGPSKADPSYCTKGRPLTMTWKPISRSSTKPSRGWESTAGSAKPKGTQPQPARMRHRQRPTNSRERSECALANSRISPCMGTETGSSTKSMLIAMRQQDLPQARTIPTKSQTSASADSSAKVGFPKILSCQGRTMKIRVEFKVIIGPRDREEIGTVLVESFFNNLAQNFNHKASRPLYRMVANTQDSHDDPSRWRIYPWEEPNDPGAEACKLLRSDVVRWTTVLGLN